MTIDDISLLICDLQSRAKQVFRSFDHLKINNHHSYEKAKRLENDKLDPKVGSALSWYLKAREIYPQSRYAKDGIQHIIDQEFGKTE